jgi:hypothetical protein
MEVYFNKHKNRWGKEYITCRDVQEQRESHTRRNLLNERYFMQLNYLAPLVSFQDGSATVLESKLTVYSFLQKYANSTV